MTITFNLFVQKVPLTFESIITKLEINPKAHGLIANMKAVLTSDELRYEFMMRVPHKPSGSNINSLLDEMREEQLYINPMSDESFLDMYMLNPLQALMQYFKHSVSTAHLERAKQWRIDIKDVMRIKRKENNIHLNDVLERLYLN